MKQDEKTSHSSLLVKDIKYGTIIKLYFTKHQAKMIKNKIQTLWTLKMNITTRKNKIGWKLVLDPK